MTNDPYLEAQKRIDANTDAIWEKIRAANLEKEVRFLLDSKPLTTQDIAY